MTNKIDLTLIPADIIAEIRATAKAVWPNIRELQDELIEAELNGYLAFHSADFGAAQPAKASIVAGAMDPGLTWEERASELQGQIAAYSEIQALDTMDIPSEIFAEMKRKADCSGVGYYDVELDELNAAIDGYRYVYRDREKVRPILDLLVRMEEIIGRECYQNYRTNHNIWGEWYESGKGHSSFRDLVTFIQDGKAQKHQSDVADLQREKLVDGLFELDTNALSIFRAMTRVIEMLEADYGFERPTAVR
ncbi:hypothetical protein [Parasphingorhabdus sp.]|uniref:hypothetical protein n=1 Tax=Parasphingorhabdus sp. TaxID=2709688 RepID=UPI0030027488